MYTEQELKQLRRAIYENVAQRLMWQILYINAQAQGASNLGVIRKRLSELPQEFALLMRNTIGDAAAQGLVQAVYEGSDLFMQYVDSFFHGGGDESLLQQQLCTNAQRIAQDMHQINPQWGVMQWTYLMEHQLQLLEGIMHDAKDGSYKTWAEILPIVCRLKMDMADYLAEGISSAPKRPTG